MKKLEKMKNSISNIKNGANAFLISDWDVKDKSLVIAASVLAGILIGIIISPIKGGIFSNNRIGCDNIGSMDDDDDDFED